jgi:hypothetical protein
MKMTKQMMIVFMAVGGFFMAETFTSSDSSVPQAEAETPVIEAPVEIELFDSIELSDSVEVSTP